MGIEQSRTGSYQKEVMTRSGSVYNETVFPWKCSCDFCGKEAHKMGENAGEAADAARKDNFTTVPSKSITLPSRWACTSCKEKIDSGKKFPLVDAMKHTTNVRDQSKKTG